MSLATRCIHCGTIFRVVQDQLKISEGWVRCGRCQEVFSALEGLFDLEREAPPQRADKTSATQVAAQGVADFVASHHPLPSDLAAETQAAGGTEAEAGMVGMSPFDEATAHGDIEVIEYATAPLHANTGDTGDSQVDLDLELDRVEPRFNDPPLAAPLRGEDFSGGSEVTAGFLAQAHPARTRWHSPGMRAGLSAAAVLLAVGLVGQLAFQFRDAFAAQWPQSRPAIEALCEATGCRIEALRRLAAVSVEASGLTQVQGSEAYRLGITLLNRSAFEVAVPFIDLSLTDGSGGLVSRRTLAPTDFSATPALVASGASLVLAPGAEVQLQALLASRAARITGYNVELFYP